VVWEARVPEPSNRDLVPSTLTSKSYVTFLSYNSTGIDQMKCDFIQDIISNLNIDSSSKNYGEYYDTKLGLLWHKRAYECGIYYHPNNDAGGIYFRINGFTFANSTKAVF
jgi:hypothetical protein